jgi:hypothetical protein
MPRPEFDHRTGATREGGRKLCREASKGNRITGRARNNPRFSPLLDRANAPWHSHRKPAASVFPPAGAVSLTLGREIRTACLKRAEALRFI